MSPELLSRAVQHRLALLRAGLRHRWAKVAVGAVCAWPLAMMVWGAVLDTLGPNPAEFLIRGTGEMALRMLCLTLMVTPLRQALGWPEWLRFRRLLGLWTYAYAVLHLLCYAVFDMGLDGGDIARDILKRPFILVGMTTWVLLTPLALTSWNGAIRWLGAARWQRLHRLVYLIAPLAVLHFLWMRSGKHNYGDVWVYGLWLAVLLGWRGWRRLRASTV